MPPISDPLVIIKLGGSLLGSPALEQWLAAIAGHGQGRAVIVPGGGHYADAVRAQTDLDEEMAHYQAFLAMRQVGNDLIVRNPAFKRADSLAAIQALLNSSDNPIAVPIDDWLFAGDIPASWDYTSDSLALWLANKLGATRLLLVKSVMPTERHISAIAATEMNLVDRAFPALHQQYPGIKAYWAGSGQFSKLNGWLAGDEQTGFCELI